MKPYSQLESIEHPVVAVSNLVFSWYLSLLVDQMTWVVLMAELALGAWQVSEWGSVVPPEVSAL
jgi:hypothetical protein